MPIHTGPHNVSSFKKGIWWKILISCIILVAIGGLNTLWTNLPYKEWYDGLAKPSFSPHPRWIVGVIWTVMYILIGGSVGIIWQLIVKSRYSTIVRYAKQAIWVFIIQVIVNISIPALFFGLNSLGLVLAGAVVNLLLVLFIFKRFFRLDRLSGFLLIPYILWLGYSIILDIVFVAIN